jgi:hypothetical protein
LNFGLVTAAAASAAAITRISTAAAAACIFRFTAAAAPAAAAACFTLVAAATAAASASAAVGCLVVHGKLQVVQKTSDELIRGTGCASYYLNAEAGKSFIGSVAHSAADDGVDSGVSELFGKSFVALACGIQSTGAGYLIIFNVIDSEGRGTAEVLADDVVFDRERNPHKILSFLGWFC